MTIELQPELVVTVEDLGTGVTSGEELATPESWFVLVFYGIETQF